MKQNPLDILNKIKNVANLKNEYAKTIGIKLNKPGKIRFQLIAPDVEHLFKARTQHFIQPLPNNESNENVLVVDCQGENCPICEVANSFRKSGITVEQINDAYNPRYPYPKLRNFLTQPEHFLVAARVLLDNADEGNYLPKDAEIGSTQILQLSRTAFNNLMTSYEDFLSDYDDDIEELPPLFGIVDDSKEEGVLNSLSITLRISVQGAWSYNFSFGKGVSVKIEDVDSEKLGVISSDTFKVTEDYMEKAIKRIESIKNYIINGNNWNSDEIIHNDTPKSNVVEKAKQRIAQQQLNKEDINNIDNILDDDDTVEEDTKDTVDDDFDLDTL